ncbi:MAG: hypothetical protein RTU30_03125 [Candidatus Thorarchaeota archaeon]
MSEGGDSDIDWTDYAYLEEGKERAVHLDLTDYVALFIASLQTIFLPLVVLGVFLFCLSLFFTIFF